MINVSIDIGSTPDKGAVFDVGSDDHIELKNYALTPRRLTIWQTDFFTVLE